MMRDAIRKFFALGPVAGIFTIAALLPFERIGSFSIAGANVRPSQIVLVLTMLATTRAAFHRRMEIGWRQPEILALLAFFAACALSLINAENLGRSLMILAFTAFTAMLALLMPDLIRTPEQAKTLRSIIYISAAVVGLFGLWQFTADMAGLPALLTGLRPQYTKAILGFTRVQSTSLEPLYFADYLLLPMGLAIAHLLSGADRKTTWRLGALLIVLFIDLVLTASRGGYGGFAATVVIILWMLRKKLPALKRFAVIAAVGVAAVILALSLLGSYSVTTPDSLSGTFLRHIGTLTDGAAFAERVDTFNGALRAFALHPWIGIGIGGYGPFMATYPHVQPEAGWPIVNNETLELLAEVGILGLAAFVMFIILVFRQGFRTGPAGSEPIRIGVLAALAGMMVQYQTFSTLYIMHVWFTIGLVLALTSRTHRDILQPRNTSE